MTTNKELTSFAEKMGLRIKVLMRDGVAGCVNEEHGSKNLRTEQAERAELDPLDGIIVNLQTSEHMGTHWVMMSKRFNVYYDSYGLPAILEAFQYLGRRDFEFTPFQTQPLTYDGGQSTICGELCLWVLMKLVEGYKFVYIINDII